MVSGNAPLRLEVQPVLDGAALSFQEYVFNLEVLQDLSLLNGGAVEATSVCQLHPFLELVSHTCLSHTKLDYIVPIIYSHSEHVGLHFKNVWKLQFMQNAAARRISDAC